MLKIFPVISMRRCGSVPYNPVPRLLLPSVSDRHNRPIFPVKNKLVNLR